MKIYFVTSSKQKYEEMKKIFDLPGSELVYYEKDIAELQTEDEETLVRHKVLEAFKELRRPVMIEHSALRINAFGKLPGLQTRNFYDKIGYQNIIDFCKMKDCYEAEAESIIGICDGKSIEIVRGIDPGTIVNSTAALVKGFSWDEVFVPTKNNPHKKTYAQMGEEKHERSMRKQAWDAMKSRLLNKQDGFLMGSEETVQLKQLAKLITEKKVMLFVGAGISASVKLPTWGRLIEQLGAKKGFDKDLFQCYGDNMLLAEYADLDGNVYEELKNNFDIQNNTELCERLGKSEIYQKIYELDFPVIYTTNYDHLIEEYYKQKGKREYTVIKNIEDMSRLKTGQTRIMKFHGDLEDEQSIVLSESQYFKRMDFQNFMDIQLQADMLQYKILFLGYSLSDINIKLLLYLARKRAHINEKSESQQEFNAYIFTATPNQVQKDVFAKNRIASLSGDMADKEKGTLEFLKQLLDLGKVVS